MAKRSFHCPDCGLTYETYSPSRRFKRCDNALIGSGTLVWEREWIEAHCVKKPRVVKRGDCWFIFVEGDTLLHFCCGDNAWRQAIDYALFIKTGRAMFADRMKRRYPFNVQLRPHDCGCSRGDVLAQDATTFESSSRQEAGRHEDQPCQ